MKATAKQVNDIFSVMSPGREYTRNDITNRLKSKGIRLSPDIIASALYSMARRGIVKSDFVGAAPQITVYAIQEAR